MSSEKKIINLDDVRSRQSRTLLGDPSFDPFASTVPSTATEAQPVTTTPAGNWESRYRKVSFADVTEADLLRPGFWASVVQKPMPGDIRAVYTEPPGAVRPHYLGTVECVEIGPEGPIMRPWAHPRPLRADAVLPAEPIDAVMAFLKSAHSPLSVADLAIMAGLTSRRERMIVKAIERLGWSEPWPPEFSEPVRNERIRATAEDICTDAGVSTNEAPSKTAVKRFYRAIAAVAPRRRTERK